MPAKKKAASKKAPPPASAAKRLPFPVPPAAPSRRSKAAKPKAKIPQMGMPGLGSGGGWG